MIFQQFEPWSFLEGRLVKIALQMGSGLVLPWLWGKEAWRCAGKTWVHRHHAAVPVREWIKEIFYFRAFVPFSSYWKGNFNLHRLWMWRTCSRIPAQFSPGHSSINDKGEWWASWWNMKRERRREDRVREVNGLIQRSSRRWPALVLPVCRHKVRAGRSQTGPLTGRSAALIWIFHVILPFCCHRSLLLTAPSVYLPNSLSTPCSISRSGTSQLSLCSLSRWPSSRSALECCFYIAASGGMWSRFWTARQTDGGFHAAFMRLGETFP